MGKLSITLTVRAVVDESGALAAFGRGETVPNPGYVLPATQGPAYGATVVVETGGRRVVGTEKVEK